MSLEVETASLDVQIVSRQDGRPDLETVSREESSISGGSSVGRCRDKSAAAWKVSRVQKIPSPWGWRAAGSSSSSSSSSSRNPVAVEKASLQLERRWELGESSDMWGTSYDRDGKGGTKVCTRTAAELPLPVAAGNTCRNSCSCSSSIACIKKGELSLIGSDLTRAARLRSLAVPSHPSARVCVLYMH
eukprot:Gregarina_sp_Poly_1__9280@NODE_574_length_7474_cov_93_385311_g158_i1_p5_GENE_NODE_574_length_7474_cov_93_385311_g158_i1NODE_574_length_7474_cov_93_385311_g158_i1_p5_ORF_typecomplete_len188_score20_56IMPa_N_2/PF18650_1/0_061_NODE_574_length_7474_cov_93_385311_g158_i146865249